MRENARCPSFRARYVGASIYISLRPRGFETDVGGGNGRLPDAIIEPELPPDAIYGRAGVANFACAQARGCEHNLAACCLFASAFFGTR